MKQLLSIFLLIALSLATKAQTIEYCFEPIENVYQFSFDGEIISFQANQVFAGQIENVTVNPALPTGVQYGVDGPKLAVSWFDFNIQPVSDTWIYRVELSGNPGWSFDYLEFGVLNDDQWPVAADYVVNCAPDDPVIEDDVQFDIYPNPVYSDYCFWVQMDKAKTARIFNVLGSQVYHGYGASQEVMIREPGTYFVEVDGRLKTIQVLRK
jgi:hypothetical protein